MSKLFKYFKPLISFFLFTASAFAQGIEDDLILPSDDTVQTSNDTVVIISDQNEKYKIGKISFALTLHGGYSLMNVYDVIAELDLPPRGSYSGGYFSFAFNPGIEYIPVPIAGFNALIGKTGMFHLGIFGNIGACSHSTKVIDTMHVVDITTGWGGIQGEKSLIYRGAVDWRGGFVAGGGKVWVKSTGGLHFSEKFALLGIHSKISRRFLKWFSTGMETKIEYMFSLEDAKTTHYDSFKEPAYQFRSFSPSVVLFVSLMTH